MRQAISLLAVLGVVACTGFVRADFDAGGQNANTKAATQTSKPAIKAWEVQDLLLTNLNNLNGVAWLEVAKFQFVMGDRSLAGQPRRGPSNIPTRKNPRPQTPANAPYSW